MLRSALALLVLSFMSLQDLVDTPPSQEHELSSWTAVTIGVKDLDAALDLWIDDFGFEVMASLSGSDPHLAALWSIDAQDIERQALVGTPRSKLGLIHLVQFVRPDDPVREGAAAFDSCPKNLDIYVTDMPARLEQLRARGRSFRNNEYSEITAPNGIKFREMHMPGHDYLNIVLLEILGADLGIPESGFSGVGPLIVVVDQADEEQAFYRDVIGLDQLSDNILRGPAIEKMIGLPPGAALDVSIWGRAESPLGQIEIIDYQGVDGADLYPRAQPKALGILHVSYEMKNLDVMRERLAARGTEFVEHGSVTTLYNTGPVISFQTPGGFRIEVHENGET